MYLIVILTVFIDQGGQLLPYLLGRRDRRQELGDIHGPVTVDNGQREPVKSIQTYFRGYDLE